MKSSTLGAVCAGILLSSTLTTAHAAAVSGQGTWETTLQGRDLDGNLATFEAYYDTDLNITWLADANYSKTTGYGGMSWSAAKTWAAGLNPYGSGITGWRLPTTVDVGNDGCSSYPNPAQGVDCGYNITTHSEMSHLFYVTLGDKAYYTTTGSGPQVGWGLTNTGPFSNVQANWFDHYWSATEYVLSSDAWYFSFFSGYQNSLNKASGSYAWAVHAGDVSATAVVPLPAAAWLFCSGLLGLVGVSRKRRCR